MEANKFNSEFAKWLLRSGDNGRRKELLRKLRANFIRLGGSRKSFKEALCQLKDSPVVLIERLSGHDIQRLEKSDACNRNLCQVFSQNFYQEKVCHSRNGGRQDRYSFDDVNHYQRNTFVHFEEASSNRQQTKRRKTLKQSYVKSKKCSVSKKSTSVEFLLIEEQAHIGEKGIKESSICHENRESVHVNNASLNFNVKSNSCEVKETVVCNLAALDATALLTDKCQERDYEKQSKYGNIPQRKEPVKLDSSCSFKSTEYSIRHVLEESNIINNPFILDPFTDNKHTSEQLPIISRTCSKFQVKVTSNKNPQKHHSSVFTEMEEKLKRIKASEKKQSSKKEQNLHVKSSWVRKLKNRKLAKSKYLYPSKFKTVKTNRVSKCQVNCLENSVTVMKTLQFGHNSIKKNTTSKQTSEKVLPLMENSEASCVSYKTSKVSEVNLHIRKLSSQSKWKKMCKDLFGSEEESDGDAESGNVIEPISTRQSVADSGITGVERSSTECLRNDGELAAYSNGSFSDSQTERTDIPNDIEWSLIPIELPHSPKISERRLSLISKTTNEDICRQHPSIKSSEPDKISENSDNKLNSNIFDNTSNNDNSENSVENICDNSGLSAERMTTDSNTVSGNTLSQPTNMISCNTGTIKNCNDHTSSLASESVFQYSFHNNNRYLDNFSEKCDSTENDCVSVTIKSEDCGDDLADPSGGVNFSTEQNQTKKLQVKTQQNLGCDQNIMDCNEKFSVTDECIDSGDDLGTHTHSNQLHQSQKKETSLIHPTDNIVETEKHQIDDYKCSSGSNDCTKHYLSEISNVDSSGKFLENENFMVSRYSNPMVPLNKEINLICMDNEALISNNENVIVQSKISCTEDVATKKQFNLLPSEVKARETFSKNESVVEALKCCADMSQNKIGLIRVKAPESLGIASVGSNIQLSTENTFVNTYGKYCEKLVEFACNFSQLKTCMKLYGKNVQECQRILRTFGIYLNSCSDLAVRLIKLEKTIRVKVLKYTEEICTINKKTLHESLLWLIKNFLPKHKEKLLQTVPDKWNGTSSLERAIRPNNQSSNESNPVTLENNMQINRVEFQQNYSESSSNIVSTASGDTKNNKESVTIDSLSGTNPPLCTNSIYGRNTWSSFHQKVTSNHQLNSENSLTNTGNGNSHSTNGIWNNSFPNNSSCISLPSTVVEPNSNCTGNQVLANASNNRQNLPFYSYGYSSQQNVAFQRNQTNENDTRLNITPNYHQLSSADSVNASVNTIHSIENSRNIGSWVARTEKPIQRTQDNYQGMQNCTAMVQPAQAPLNVQEIQQNLHKSVTNCFPSNQISLTGSLRSNFTTQPNTITYVRNVNFPPQENRIPPYLNQKDTFPSMSQSNYTRIGKPPPPYQVSTASTFSSQQSNCFVNMNSQQLSISSRCQNNSTYQLNKSYNQNNLHNNNNNNNVQKHLYQILLGSQGQQAQISQNVSVNQQSDKGIQHVKTHQLEAQVKMPVTYSNNPNKGFSFQQSKDNVSANSQQLSIGSSAQNISMYQQNKSYNQNNLLNNNNIVQKHLSQIQLGSQGQQAQISQNASVNQQSDKGIHPVKTRQLETQVKMPITYSNNTKEGFSFQQLHTHNQQPSISSGAQNISTYQQNKTYNQNNLLNNNNIAQKHISQIQPRRHDQQAQISKNVSVKGIQPVKSCQLEAQVKIPVTYTNNPNNAFSFQQINGNISANSQQPSVKSIAQNISTYQQNKFLNQSIVQKYLSQEMRLGSHGQQAQLPQSGNQPSGDWIQPVGTRQSGGQARIPSTNNDFYSNAHTNNFGKNLNTQQIGSILNTNCQPLSITSGSQNVSTYQQNKFYNQSNLYNSNNNNAEKDLSQEMRLGFNGQQVKISQNVSVNQPSGNRIQLEENRQSGSQARIPSSNNDSYNSTHTNNFKNISSQQSNYTRSNCQQPSISSRAQNVSTYQQTKFYNESNHNNSVQENLSQAMQRVNHSQQVQISQNVAINHTKDKLVQPTETQQLDVQEKSPVCNIEFYIKPPVNNSSNTCSNVINNYQLSTNCSWSKQNNFVQDMPSSTGNSMMQIRKQLNENENLDQHVNSSNSQQKQDHSAIVNKLNPVNTIDVNDNLRSIIVKCLKEESDSLDINSEHSASSSSRNNILPFSCDISHLNNQGHINTEEDKINSSLKSKFSSKIHHNDPCDDKMKSSDDQSVVAVLTKSDEKFVIDDTIHDSQHLGDTQVVNKFQSLQNVFHFNNDDEIQILDIPDPLEATVNEDLSTDIEFICEVFKKSNVTPLKFESDDVLEYQPTKLDPLLNLSHRTNKHAEDDINLHAETPIEPRTVSRDSGYTTPTLMVPATTNDMGKVTTARTNLESVLCSVCFKSAKLVCGGCRITCYCSKKCRDEHWENLHNLECSFDYIDVPVERLL